MAKIKASLTLVVTFEGPGAEPEYADEIRSQLEYCGQHLAEQGLLTGDFLPIEVEGWTSKVEIPVA